MKINFNLIGISLTIVAMISSVFILVMVERAPIVSEKEDYGQQIEAIKSQVSDIEKRLENLEFGIVETSDQAKVELQVNTLTNTINEVQTRVVDLEQLILDDPIKALEVTLLRNDLEDMKEDYRYDISTMQKEMDRSYSMMRWVFGLMFVMTAGILSVAISNSFRREKEHGKG